MLEKIGLGLCEGTKTAQVSITGGEIAQLKDVVLGFDLVGTAVGRVELDKILTGQNIHEGDIVIGIRSNGVHANGLSLLRRAYFELNDFSIHHKFDELSCSLGDELLKPTHIYVREAMELIETLPGLRALVNITSDGFLNLTRVTSDVGYVIENLPDSPPIFSIAQQWADVDDSEMYEVFNMGIGFCVVVESGVCDQALAILRHHDRIAEPIGYAVQDLEKRVWITQHNLVGRDKNFTRT